MQKPLTAILIQLIATGVLLLAYAAAGFYAATILFRKRLLK